MALTTNDSYVPVMQQFIDHWTDVNAAISPGVMLLEGGFTLANFTAAQAGIQAAITAITAADNNRQITATGRDVKKAALKVRLIQFRGAVASQLADSDFGKAPPTVPTFSAAQGPFMKDIDDMADLWTKINAATIPGFTGPLKLSGGYAVATFNTDITAMYAAYTAANSATNSSTVARRHRDNLLGPAKTRMIQYRRGVVSVLPAGHELLSSIPSITPAPGSTPAAVAATGIWSVADTLGILTWAASTNPNFDHFSIRTSPGPKYDSSEESVIIDLPAGTLTYSTLEGLAAPGASAVYKVYVVLTTGNEKGSNVVRIVRPG